MLTTYVLLNSSKQCFLKPFQRLHTTHKYLTSNMRQETSENKVKMCEDFLCQNNDFLSQIFPLLGFLNFWRSESEFVISNFLQTNTCTAVSYKNFLIQKEFYSRFSFRLAFSYLDK